MTQSENAIETLTEIIKRIKKGEVQGLFMVAMLKESYYQIADADTFPSACEMMGHVDLCKHALVTQVVERRFKNSAKHEVKGPSDISH